MRGIRQRHTHTLIHTDTHRHKHIHTRTHTHTHTHTLTHTDTHTHTHTHTVTLTCKHTHTRTLSQALAWREGSSGQGAPRAVLHFLSGCECAARVCARVCVYNSSRLIL